MKLHSNSYLSKMFLLELLSETVFFLYEEERSGVGQGGLWPQKWRTLTFKFKMLLNTH